MFFCIKTTSLTYSLKVVQPEVLVPHAEEVIQKWLKLPPFGRSSTKMFMRNDLAVELLDGCQEEIEQVWEMIQKPEISGMIGKYISNLSKPKSKL